MKANSKFLIAMLLVAIVGVFLYRSRVYSEPTPPEQPNLVVVTGGSGAYWQELAEGAKAAGKDLDAKVEVLMPELGEVLAAQADLINGINATKVDGIAISPIDAEAQTRSIDRLSADTLVVTVDSDAPLSSRLSYVGASNRAAGQKAGELLQEALPDGGKVAVLLANLSKNNLVERQNGFQAQLGLDEESTPDDRFQIVDYLLDEGDDERCFQQVEQLLEQHDDLAGLVGMNARHGPILMSVLEKAGKLGEIKVIAFDTAPETLEGIERGNIVASVAQDPYQYGYEAIQLLDSFSRRRAAQLPPPGLYSTMTISTKVIRRDNLDEVREHEQSSEAE